MTDKITADLTHEIGGIIVADEEFANDRWQGIALVATMHDHSEEVSGYQYYADGSWEAAAPINFEDIVDKLLELREHMEKTGQGKFLQCLIHITKPNYALRIQYEYDKQKRWWPEKISMDMSQFAELLRPEDNT